MNRNIAKRIIIGLVFFLASIRVLYILHMENQMEDTYFFPIVSVITLLYGLGIIVASILLQQYHSCTETKEVESISPVKVTVYIAFLVFLGISYFYIMDMSKVLWKVSLIGISLPLDLIDIVKVSIFMGYMLGLLFLYGELDNS